MFIQSLFFILSLILTFLFFLYGFNHYFLLHEARHYAPPPLPKLAGDLPSVSIQLPIFNEKYVVHRLIAACTRMAEAYGIEKVRILILDDSDDDTVSVIDKEVENFVKDHYHISVIRRGNRQGFKAGALKAALEKTPEDFIAIFDADFVPTPDFLSLTIPHFIQDKRLGVIQSRWTHLNRESNLLTKAISFLIDIHFLVEQPGRYAAGCFQNFNGSGGVLRKKAILEAGGWQADTLAEDLDLSYRIQMLGYRLLYLRDLQNPGEIPVTIPSLKVQQGRWACGSLQNARKILPSLLANRKIGFKQHLQAFIHLTGYMIHPMMVVSFLITCIATLSGLNNPHLADINSQVPVFGNVFAMRAISGDSPQNLTWLFLSPFIALCTLAPWISLVSTLKVQNFSLIHNLLNVIVVLLIGFGLSLNNTREAAKALFTNNTWEFGRTPKYADLQNKQDWKFRKYQIRLDFLWIAEIAFAILGFLSIGLAFLNSNFFPLFILVPFTFGYAYVCVLTILQSRRETNASLFNS
jgi:cellulose synthase/poly-beta-1,6-N-acetylglucosamine synthase-like glycosyltransferase